MRYSFQDRPVSKFGPPIWNCDKSHFSQLPCIRRHNQGLPRLTMSQPTWWRGGRGLPSLIALFGLVMKWLRYLDFRVRDIKFAKFVHNMNWHKIMDIEFSIIYKSCLNGEIWVINTNLQLEIIASSYCIVFRCVQNRYALTRNHGLCFSNPGSSGHSPLKQNYTRTAVQTRVHRPGFNVV